ncbi:MAG TPA: CPBP family intramembrane metalloprotease [Saprospiraceae bacterium]|nr:CPBP family intramembrane metalloprotease [Saprospiraceae bacterium]
MKQKIQDILQFKVGDLHFYFLLISAPILITLYRYFSQSSHFLKLFPSLSQNELGNIISYELQFVGFFILMFVLPMLHILLLWEKPLSEFGFGLGDTRYGVKFLVLSLLFLVVPFAFCGSFDPNVTSEYPLAKALIQHKNQLPVYHLFYTVFYYIAWEFYFRGYLLFGLKERYGVMEAILIQTISSCLIHIDKPFAEIILSIPVGIFLGFVALRSRSFWYVFLVHASLGVLTDIFIIYLHNR